MTGLPRPVAIASYGVAALGLAIAAVFDPSPGPLVFGGVAFVLAIPLLVLGRPQVRKPPWIGMFVGGLVFLVAVALAGLQIGGEITGALIVIATAATAGYLIHRYERVAVGMVEVDERGR